MLWRWLNVCIQILSLIKKREERGNRELESAVGSLRESTKSRGGCMRELKGQNITTCHQGDVQSRVLSSSDQSPFNTVGHQSGFHLIVEGSASVAVVLKAGMCIW